MSSKSRRTSWWCVEFSTLITYCILSYFLLFHWRICDGWHCTTKAMRRVALCLSSSSCALQPANLPGGQTEGLPRAYSHPGNLQTFIDFCKVDKGFLMLQSNLVFLHVRFPTTTIIIPRFLKIPPAMQSLMAMAFSVNVLTATSRSCRGKPCRSSLLGMM
jgi:hypothetical protein